MNVQRSQLGLGLELKQAQRTGEKDPAVTVGSKVAFSLHVHKRRLDMHHIRVTMTKHNGFEKGVFSPFVVLVTCLVVLS